MLKTKSTAMVVMRMLRMMVTIVDMVRCVAISMVIIVPGFTHG